jgi:hypothetical protein
MKRAVFRAFAETRGFKLVGQGAFAAAAITLLVCCTASPSAAQIPIIVVSASAPPSLFLRSLGYIGQDISQVGSTGIQQQIWGIEDRLQGRPDVGSRPMGFAEEPESGNPVIDSAFAALGYSGDPNDPKSPFMVKARPAAVSQVSYSAWAQGLVDYENRTGTFDGIDIGRNTLIGGGIAAADMTIQHVTSASDAVVFGILTGDLTATVRNADGSTAVVHGPSLGAYSAYVNGAFSVDGTFKTDFFTVTETDAGIATPLGLNNYVATGNVNYKQNMGTWWFQPTAGVSYTRTVWNTESSALGFTDGTDVRVQGGARFGSGFDWAGIHFDQSLTVLAYDDVLISGGTLAVVTGTPLAPTDEGKIFGQVIGKVEAQLTANWSVNVEGEFRGSTDVYGVAGRVGATYTFN